MYLLPWLKIRQSQPQRHHSRLLEEAKRHLRALISPITTSIETSWGGWLRFSVRALWFKLTGMDNGGLQDAKRDEEGWSYGP